METTIDQPLRGIDRILENLYKAIAARNLDDFEEAFEALETVCRMNIFSVDKEVLDELYKKLNIFIVKTKPILINSGKSAWPEVCMMIGGINVLWDIIGELRLTESHHEIVDMILTSEIDKDLIINLAQKDGFIRSGELAKLAVKNQQSVTNRLPELEKKGLISRVRRGKNSFIGLTEKGLSAGRTLLQKELVDDYNPCWSVPEKSDKG